jgi:hypothetical protein
VIAKGMLQRADPTVRVAILLTALLALLALVALALAGHLRAGLAIDLGLVVGAVNGPLIQRSAQLGFAFGALAFGRLLFLSLLAVGLGLLLGLDVLWLVVGGVALAQLVLAGTAFWRVVTG